MIEEVPFFGNETRIKGFMLKKVVDVNIISNLRLEDEVGNIYSEKGMTITDIDTSIESAKLTLFGNRGQANCPTTVYPPFASPFKVILEIKEKDKIIYDNKFAKAIFDSSDVEKQYWRQTRFMNNLLEFATKEERFFYERLLKQEREPSIGIALVQVQMYNAGRFYLPKITKPVF
jgi:hypothetical protein